MTASVVTQPLTGGNQGSSFAAIVNIERSVSGRYALARQLSTAWLCVTIWRAFGGAAGRS
jgi:hypothetical protein